jgi:hypothetical protein
VISIVVMLAALALGVAASLPLWYAARARARRTADGGKPGKPGKPGAVAVS